MICCTFSCQKCNVGWGEVTADKHSWGIFRVYYQHLDDLLGDHLDHLFDGLLGGHLDYLFDGLLGDHLDYLFVDLLDDYLNYLFVDLLGDHLNYLFVDRLGDHLDYLSDDLLGDHLKYLFDEFLGDFLINFSHFWVTCGCIAFRGLSKRYYTNVDAKPTNTLSVGAVYVVNIGCHYVL